MRVEVSVGIRRSDEWEEAMREREKHDEAVRAFKKRCLEERPGLRVTGWGALIFFVKVVVVTIGAYLLIVEAFSLPERFKNFLH